ncbi:MAG: zinc-ribbon domain containing protein [Pirellulales bacterium]|nr:zinc-ribbon domain containing protein [Pirellulales bacterium]
MTKRRKEMREKKALRRRRRLEAEGRMVNGVEIPKGAIPADISKQIPAGYSNRYYYKDREFTCVECGTVEVWTAKAQQWYFEVIKAHPASEATHCSECRKKRNKAKEEQRRHMD